MMGTTPGSKMLYETPLNVVPTSIPTTNLHRVPEYGLLPVDIIEEDKEICAQRS
jgi:hypothetical protein